jgi:hypothetical protein
MGEVFEAEDRQRGERVALKTLPNLTAAAIYRLKQEFRALAGVVHPNLISLFELVGEAAASLTRQGVKRADRFAAVLAPWIP